MGTLLREKGKASRACCVEGRAEGTKSEGAELKESRRGVEGEAGSGRAVRNF